jgi:hypothetical protein
MVFAAVASDWWLLNLGIDWDLMKSRGIDCAELFEGPRV